jgi:hypothetical protein
LNCIYYRPGKSVAFEKIVCVTITREAATPQRFREGIIGGDIPIREYWTVATTSSAKFHR